MPPSVEDTESKALCRTCVGDAHLAAEIDREGRVLRCSYCGRRRRAYTLTRLADRVEEVFERHYVRTADQPDGYQLAMMADRESDYDWDRDGEATVYAIMNSADMPEQAARDVQEILGDRHSDVGSEQIGEETEFSCDAHYEERKASDDVWQEGWARFERTLKTEARFFSRVAAAHLEAVFADLGDLRTRDGRPLVTDAGPGTTLPALFRARVFHSDDAVERALCHPDRHLGPPPAKLAGAGRMNAWGISVFYGATEAGVAVAEVRPPVGSRVVVARFEIVRPLRVLDLTALAGVTESGSVYDPTLASRLGRARFLRSLAQRMTRPVMPDDEAFDYLPTQAVADFLATEAREPLDGIVFPSAQSSEGRPNAVLFHKAAGVEARVILEGTLEAESGWHSEDGFEVEYVVWEGVRDPSVVAIGERTPSGESDLAPQGPGPDRATSGGRVPALRVDVESMTVRHMTGVRYDTADHEVAWRRRGGGADDF